MCIQMIDQIRGYILENFMYTDDPSELENHSSLFDDGIIDSTGIIELVSFIEERRPV